MQGVANGHKAVIGHHSKEKDVQYCRKYEKINLCNTTFISDNLVLGLDVPQHLWMVVEVKQMSTNERLERKKYMGVWSRGSDLTASMMNRFPNIVIRYMETKSPNMRGCNSGSSENPRRKNLEMCVLLSSSMCSRSLAGKKEIILLIFTQTCLFIHLKYCKLYFIVTILF